MGLDSPANDRWDVISNNRSVFYRDKLIDCIAVVRQDQLWPRARRDLWRRASKSKPIVFRFLDVVLIDWIGYKSMVVLEAKIGRVSILRFFNSAAYCEVVVTFKVGTSNPILMKFSSSEIGLECIVL